MKEGQINAGGCSVGKGSMIAVLGLKIDEINQFLQETKSKGICEIANDNAEGQIIISGNVEGIDF